MPRNPDERPRRQAPLFAVGETEMLSIYDDNVVIRSAKKATTIAIDHIAGVVYHRSLPWYGNYRLTFVFLDEQPRRRFGSVVLSHGKVMRAIEALKAIAASQNRDLVVRRGPYPWINAFSLLGFLVVPPAISMLRDVEAGGGILALMAFLAFVLAMIEVVVESRHEPAPSYIERAH
jgi:hypothetical protein